MRHLRPFETVLESSANAGRTEANEAREFGNRHRVVVYGHKHHDQLRKPVCGFGSVIGHRTPKRYGDQYMVKFDPIPGYKGGTSHNEPPEWVSDVEDLDTYLRRRVAEDPMFVTTELFRRLAPKDLKDQYPEAGNDFGFFDARGTNEIFGFDRKKEPKKSISDGLTVSANGTRVWRTDGKFHRTDGPAIEYADGGKEWFVDGKKHRTDGPAIVRPDGRREWWVNGEPHRTDGPAAEFPDGTRMWFRNGRRHRTDGPAAEWPTAGTLWWWVNGKELTEDEFRGRFPKKYRKWWESQVGKPWFKDAPRSIKDKHPEAGADFGFFDSRRNESKAAPPPFRFDVGDKVVWIQKEGPSPFMYSPVFSTVLRRCRVLDDVTYTVSYGWSDGAIIALSCDRLVSTDDYLREKVEENPAFVNSPTFRQHASPELRDAYPEAGADFGFFDAKNEALVFYPFRQGDLVAWDHQGWILTGTVVFFQKAGHSMDVVEKVQFWYESGRLARPDNRKYLLSDIDANPADKYIRRRLAKDPGFATTEFFKRCASPKLKAEYPEAGADFGFFDAAMDESIYRDNKEDNRPRPLPEAERLLQEEWTFEGRRLGVDLPPDGREARGVNSPEARRGQRIPQVHRGAVERVSQDPHDPVPGILEPPASVDPTNF